ncbi:hypothetical protein C1645_737756 [Glomus cerebriforme]|uniref:Uncharacterized protein n=1 Tax=Glomus cerebriforme TaxID=658196 RepID=A0A397SWP1_9GLOM|nr:hypothetical protein C1645_737756 [Glomus cerebriforme]
MHYHLLFGIIFLSSFGSALADEYNPKPDVFDQIINALVPTLIVFLFDTKESEEGKRSEESGDEEKSEVSRKKKKSIITIVRIRRMFDDFLFLLSLFVLPSIVFYKNRKENETPLWIPILFGVTSFFVFIILISNYILNDKKGYKNVYAITYSALSIDLSHVISDICFIFYTRNIPANNFTDIFIYLHSVTGILGAIVLLFYIVIYIAGGFYFEHLLNIMEPIEHYLRKFTITITFLWTPIVQMLNMSLLSGNDYYWTKSILALNLIYFSRVLNYAEKKVDITNGENIFGMLNIIFAINQIKK